MNHENNDTKQRAYLLHHHAQLTAVTEYALDKGDNVMQFIRIESQPSGRIDVHVISHGGGTRLESLATYDASDFTQGARDLHTQVLDRLGYAATDGTSIFVRPGIKGGTKRAAYSLPCSDPLSSGYDYDLESLEGVFAFKSIQVRTVFDQGGRKHAVIWAKASPAPGDKVWLATLAQCSPNEAMERLGYTIEVKNAVPA